MAVYLFDLHSGSLSSWDDHGCGCEGPDEIVQHAKQMLTSALEGTRDGHAVVSVRDGIGVLILTVTLSRTRGLRTEWTEPPEVQP
jgi:uncharacterized protein DUF6894